MKHIVSAMVLSAISMIASLAQPPCKVRVQPPPVGVSTNALAHELGHSFGLLDCYSCKTQSTVMIRFDHKALSPTKNSNVIDPRNSAN